MDEKVNSEMQLISGREGQLPQSSVSVLFSYGIHLPEKFGEVEDLARNFFQKGKANYLLLESGKPVPDNWNFNQERSIWGSYKRTVVAVVLKSLLKREPKIEEVQRYTEIDFDKIRSRMDIGTWQATNLADQLEKEGYDINVQLESAPIEESRRAVERGKEQSKTIKEAMEYALRGNHKKAAKRMGANLARVASNAIHRNHRFANQVISLIEKTKSHPQESRILIRFGSSHPQIAQAVRERYQGEEFISITSKVDNEKQVLPLPDNIIQKYFDGGTVKEIELARAVLYDLFMDNKARIDGKITLATAIEISNLICAISDQNVYRLFAKLTREGIEAAKAEIGLS